MKNQTSIKLSQIKVNEQVRTKFNPTELTELKDSILKHGLLQPIGVRKINKDLVLIYGERRYRAMLEIAASNKKMDSIAAIVYEKISDSESLELQILENLQRKDVHPMDEAIAFKQLLDSKKTTVKEISKTVCKSVNYVYQRLKLNDLIKDFQVLFYEGKIGIQSLLNVCKLSIESQQELLQDLNTDKDGIIEIDAYEIKRFLNDLNNAPFDINDKNIIKEMGSCAKCPFNSAVSTLLFPEDAKNKICTNSTCFQNKCSISFDSQLQKAIEDLDCVLIHNTYQSFDTRTVALIKEGITVYNRDAYDQIEKPVMPSLEEYQESFEDEVYDSENEMQEAYLEALKEYESELKEYNDLLNSEKYLKGFVVQGNNRGTYINVVLKKAAATTPNGKMIKKEINEDSNEQDYDYEINRLQLAENRKLELDEEKVQPLLFEAANENKHFFNNITPFNRHENIAFCILFYNLVSYQMKRKFSEHFNSVTGNEFSNDLFDSLSSLDENQIADLLRSFCREAILIASNPIKGLVPSKNDFFRAFNELMKVQFPNDYDKSWEAQNVIRANRSKKLSDRITELTELKNK